MASTTSSPREILKRVETPPPRLDDGFAKGLAVKLHSLASRRV